MSIADKLATIADNEQRVYDAGYSDGESDIIEAITNHISNYGNRKDYSSAFAFTNWDGFKFAEGKIKPTDNSGRMFYAAKAVPEGIDLSGLPTSADIENFCAWCSFTEFPDMALPAMNSYYYMFCDATKIKKVEVLRVHEGTTFSGTFNRASALQEITFQGTIGKNLNMSWSTLLTHDSLMSAIDCLKDYSGDTSGTAYTLTLGSTNLAKLTAEEQQIAIDKGWTLA